MAIRVLIADPDWQFLRHAFQALPGGDYDVIVETDRSKAVTFAKHWQPKLLIAPSHFVEEWYEGREPAGPVSPCPSVLITAYNSDEPGTWEPWAAKGYEVLLKPMVHPTQLHAAVEAVLSKSPRARGSYASA